MRQCGNVGSRRRAPDSLEKSCREFCIAAPLNFFNNYFSGKQVLFDLPLDIQLLYGLSAGGLEGGQQIPFGETRSYAWIAERIGRPGSARAVGQAMGANPIPVFIP